MNATPSPRGMPGEIPRFATACAVMVTKHSYAGVNIWDLTASRVLLGLGLRITAHPPCQRHVLTVRPPPLTVSTLMVAARP